MNTIEPKLLKELINADYDSLMGFRVRRILMICSNYDAFILEESSTSPTSRACSSETESGILFSP